MKLLIFLVLATLAVKILAEPEPNPNQVFHYQVADEESVDRSHKNDKVLNTKSDASSGRLFFKKFFGQNPSPPIMPIIITGTNNDYTTNIDTPTSTAVNTPTATTTILEPTTTINTNPSGSAPITTNTPTGSVNPASPVAPANPSNPSNPENPTLPTLPTRRFQLYDANAEVNDAIEEAALNEEQNLPNAQEIIISGGQVKAPSKGNRAPAHIKLRLRGAKRDQVITVALPARYRGYFRNGQRVALQGIQSSRRPGKRRLIRRRRNRRRNNKSKKNKRRRFITV